MKLHFVCLLLNCFFLFLHLLAVPNVRSGEVDATVVAQNIDKLLRENSCRGCDLREAVLDSAQLAGADLRYANLDSARFFLANLRGANLQHCSLKGTLFNGADISDSDFRNSDIASASFLGAYRAGTLFQVKPKSEKGQKSIESISDKTGEDSQGTPTPLQQPMLTEPEPSAGPGAKKMQKPAKVRLN